MQRQGRFDADDTGDRFRIFERDRAPSRPRPRARPTMARRDREPSHEHAVIGESVAPTLHVAPTPVVAPTPARTTLREVEQEIVEILRAAPTPGETIEAAYRRKEHALGSLFARLSPVEALALHRRLSAADRDDPIASQFGRLIASRRARLLAFLADARRRAARGRGRP